MRKITVMIALLLVVALATPAIGASFPDVPDNHWSYEAIESLAATGIIEGYPDGEYKGEEDLTRYEIAMIVSRLIDNMAEEREELMARVEDMEDEDTAGLSTEQAQDVNAIVKSLIEKNMPEEPTELTEEQAEQVVDLIGEEQPTELTEEQADQVVNLIEALTFEYQAELKVLNSDYDDLRADLGLLEDDLDSVRDRVADLEDETPPVTFSGTYSVDFTHKDIIEGGMTLPGALSNYYIEEVPYGNPDYKEEVADLIEAEMQALYGAGDMAAMDAIATEYNSEMGTSLDGEDVTVAHLTELAVHKYNNGDLADPFNGAPEYTPYAVKEDVSAAYNALPMWSEIYADAVPFTDTAELTHTLTLNADIDYAGFEGQAGIELEKLADTDEVTFKSADLELENDTLFMKYNEANEIDYSYFAFSDETFNAASFLYKPWGLNTFVGMDSVVTGSYEDFSELNGFWDEDDQEVYFDGATASSTTDYIVKGAQKTFVLDMADIKVTAGARKHPDWETEKYFESLVFGAETETEIANFDLSSDVAVSTGGEFDDYGYMLKLDGSTDLMDAFTVGANYKMQDAFEDLYGSDSVFDYEEAGAAYDKYGAGLDALDSGYGLFVDHDGSADGALVSGLDLGFGYDVANYGDDSDTKIGGTASMDIMDNLTVEGSYTQLDEPSGLETVYVGETVLYDVGATFEPIEDAEITGEYSVMDPVETEINETTMDLSGSYDITDYISVNAGYTTIDGLNNYEDAEKTTMTAGASLTDYPIMTGLTGSASVDYTSVTGQEWVAEVDEVEEEDVFNPYNAESAQPGYFEEYDATTIALTSGLEYTLSERTLLTYDLGYTMKEAKDEASDLFSGDYLTNAVGVEYTFTDDADLTADYKHMMMKYDDDDGAEDWTAHQFEAGVSISF